MQYGRRNCILREFSQNKRFPTVEWFTKRYAVITVNKRSLGRGNVFTSECQEFCPQGRMYTPPEQTPPRHTTPAQTPLDRRPPAYTRIPKQTATAADGTYPTGMLSCSQLRTQRHQDVILKIITCQIFHTQETSTGDKHRRQASRKIDSLFNNT